MECEAKLQYTMQPWSYEIFKLILVDDMVDERPNFDETADEVKKEAVPVTTDSRLRAFNGDTYEAIDELDYSKVCKNPSL